MTNYKEIPRPNFSQESRQNLKIFFQVTLFSYKIHAIMKI